MHFLSVALVGLASISVASASDYKSWDDIVGDVPQCMTTCVDTFYSDSGLEDECGSSDEASMSCLCGASSFSQAESSAEDLSTCIQNKCDSGDLTNLASQLSEFSDRFSNAEEQCVNGGKLI